MKLFKQLFLLFLFSNCANIIAPNGGEADIEAPKLLNAEIITNKKNAHTKTIIFKFDEYIKLNKWDEYFYISPPTKANIQKKITGQSLLVTIEDTLNENVNYYVSLNSCIKDNNEGNILDTLNYTFSINNNTDTLTLSGNLKDAYTLMPLENAWVMLFNKDTHDTLIFKKPPNYIAKTDKNGVFHFPNLKDINYKIVALTDFDFIYNKEEKIAFADNIINIKNDTFISLYAFDPIINIDSTTENIVSLNIDSIHESTSLDSAIKKETLLTGKIEIITTMNSPCIFQLSQNKKIVAEFFFKQKPYLIDSIVAGKYNLKYIADSNQDNIWNTGNWENKKQPEKVANYPYEITIRYNWDLELEWAIEE